MASIAPVVQRNFENVLHEFTTLASDNSLSDTIFTVGNDGNTQDFHIVAALFAIRSPAFKSLLFGRLREAQATIHAQNDL